MIRRGPTTRRRRVFAGRWARLCPVAAVALVAAVGNVVVSPWVTAATWGKVHPYGKIQQYHPPGDPRQGWMRNPTQGMSEKWGGVKPDFEQTVGRWTVDEATITTRVRDWLYGQAGQYHHEVVRDLKTPGNELYDLNRKLTRTALLLQSYTKLGFASPTR